MLSDNQKEKLKKAILEGKVSDKTTLQIFNMVSELEEKVESLTNELKLEVEKSVAEVKASEISLDKVLESVKGKDGLTPTNEQLNELIKPLIPPPIQGEPGNDYILTANDKKEIAKSIKVPVVEKIIEKTETVVEQPVVTNKVVEVAKYEERQQIVEKINTGKKKDLKIQLMQIEGTDTLEKGILDRAVSILDQRTKFLINKGVKHDSTLLGDGTDANPLTLNPTEDILSITFIIDGGGSAITTGIKGDLVIPFNCTINSATLLADQTGSIVIDIWKDTYANYPPTVADTITASAKPTLSSASKAQDTTLTGWTTSITANDTLRFNVDSITTCQRVTLSLKVTKA